MKFLRLDLYDWNTLGIFAIYILYMSTCIYNLHTSMYIFGRWQMAMPSKLTKLFISLSSSFQHQMLSIKSSCWPQTCAYMYVDQKI